MNDKIQKLKLNLRHFRARSVAFALVVLIVTALIATYTGVQVHRLTKETLLLRGELNSQEAAMEYDRYLLTRENIVTMVGCTVDDLLAEGADSEAITKYLTDETDNIVSTLDPGTTGLYGLFNGEYVDGAGWVPDADYVPTERPWYTQTMQSDKEITFVDPYLDMQTKTIMMTVSKRVGDGQSVLAMDVTLGPIQSIIELVASATEGSQAFLLSADGVVVAHSDVSQLGKNYMDEPYSLGGIVARRVLSDGQRQFEVETAEGNFTVYINGLEGGWYSVSLINTDVWHRPLHRTMLIFSAILALVLLSIVGVFLRLAAKNVALQELHTRVVQEEKRGKALQALSETDRMTGLFDRVSGERKINELLSSGDGGMFMEFDIDSFKAFNDTYGHQTGDLVILGIADAMRSTFRTNDITMRLGGDEFGIFAVGITSREMGESIIGQLFRRLEDFRIPELQGEKVCISAGAVLCPEGSSLSFHALYARADDALYAAKETDGNSLIFSED